MTDMQKDMYRKFIKSKSIKKVIANAVGEGSTSSKSGGGGSTALMAITALKKIANRNELSFHCIIKKKNFFFPTIRPRARVRQVPAARRGL